MKYALTFTIEGEPASKARARVVNGHAFTPERTRRAEDLVAWRFREAARGREVTVGTWYGVRALFCAGTRQRRDVDNMLKLILDGLNGVAWGDDNSVLEVSARKTIVPKEQARTVVEIYEVDAPPHHNTFNCAACGVIVPSYASHITRGARYCSPECRNSTVKAKSTKVCPCCGAHFIKEKATYCSAACLHAYKTIDVPCTQCGVVFNRPKSWLTNGRPYCSPECRVAWHRAHRAIAARGTCETCGGHTSKKCYTRCHACKVAAQVTP